MLNTLALVGRLVNTPELKEEEGKRVTYITLAVPRSYKNEEGIYETDFIDCVLWRGIAENTIEYCKRGDLIGIKGRIQTRYVERDDFKYKKTEIVAEKVSFLSTGKSEVEDE